MNTIIHYYELKHISQSREKMKNRKKSIFFHFFTKSWKMGSCGVKKSNNTQKTWHTPLQKLKKRVKCAKYDYLAVRGPGSGCSARKTQKSPKSPFWPKMTQNDPKWPKMTQNGPKMDPKWTKNGPKMDQKCQKSCQNVMNTIIHYYELKHISQSREKTKNRKNRFFSIFSLSPGDPKWPKFELQMAIK